MKYIRTKDGSIVDMNAFIENEKTSKYYKDHIFDEIKNLDDICYIHWTAIGTKENDIKGRNGVKCDFEAYFDSQFIKQADTIEELCDALVVAGKYEGKEFHKYCPTESDSFDDLKKRYREYRVRIYGAIWTDDGLKYVAKKNKKGELELL
jgi:hypothetical protein